MKIARNRPPVDLAALRALLKELERLGVAKRGYNIDPPFGGRPLRRGSRDRELKATDWGGP